MTTIGKLLIVEDDLGVCELLKDYFQEDFDVQVANDGQSGYDLACSFRPDCIISDVMMPRLSGINMLKLIRRNPEIATVGVILLSVLSDDKDRIRGYDHLADLYFSKPFNVEELIASTVGLVTMRKKLNAANSMSLETHDIPLGAGFKDDDRKFLLRVSQVIESQMENFELNVDMVAKASHVSKRQLERRLKLLENMTPADFIRNTRLEKAKQLADTGAITSLPELAHRVGLKDTRTFIKRFKDHFGFLPHLNPPQ